MDTLPLEAETTTIRRLAKRGGIEMGWGMRKIIGLTLMAGFLLLGSAGSAQAATTIGQTFVPVVPCGAGSTYLQTTSPGVAYKTPNAGVITSWSHLAGADPGQMRFKVARGSGVSYAIVGQSPLETLTPSTPNTFPVRIPVQAGDVIGFYPTTGLPCGVNSSGFDYRYKFGDVQPAAPMTWMSGINFQLDLSATLEPDVDGDGYGDETQDGCPSDATTQGPCPAPPPPVDTDGDGVPDNSDACPSVAGPAANNGCPLPPVTDTDPPKTKISKPPPASSALSKVKVKFESDEAFSTFECKFDRKRYKPCTSPKSYKVKPGRHTIRVRAFDKAGNGDPTPAKAKFRIRDV